MSQSPFLPGWPGTRRSQINQLPSKCILDDLSPVVQTKLGHQIGSMAIDRLGTDVQHARYLRVGVPLCNEDQNLSLTVCEPLVAVHPLSTFTLAIGVKQYPRRQRMEASALFRYRPDSIGQLGSSRSLEQVTRCSGPQRLQNSLPVLMLAENQDTGASVCPHYPPSSFRAIEPRHGDIHHDDVRPELLCFVDRIQAVGSLSCYVNVAGITQQSLETIPDHCVVVDQQYSYLLHAPPLSFPLS